MVHRKTADKVQGLNTKQSNFLSSLHCIVQLSYPLTLLSIINSVVDIVSEMIALFNLYSLFAYSYCLKKIDVGCLFL